MFSTPFLVFRMTFANISISEIIWMFTESQGEVLGTLLVTLIDKLILLQKNTDGRWEKGKIHV